ncbi:MAG: hypothetical protein ACXWTG_05865 [Methylosarcina sp.]
MLRRREVTFTAMSTAVWMLHSRSGTESGFSCLGVTACSFSIARAFDHQHELAFNLPLGYKFIQKVEDVCNLYHNCADLD